MITSTILTAAHKELCCAICVDMLQDPIVLPACGHCFCRSCAERSMERSHQCPLCKTPTGSSRALLPLPLLHRVVQLAMALARSHGVEDLAFASQWSQPTPVAGTSPALPPLAVASGEGTQLTEVVPLVGSSAAVGSISPWRLPPRSPQHGGAMPVAAPTSGAPLLCVTSQKRQRSITFAEPAVLDGQQQLREGEPLPNVRHREPSLGATQLLLSPEDLRPHRSEQRKRHRSPPPAVPTSAVPVGPSTPPIVGPQAHWPPLPPRPLVTCNPLPASPSVAGVHQAPAVSTFAKANNDDDSNGVWGTESSVSSSSSSDEGPCNGHAAPQQLHKNNTLSSTSSLLASSSSSLTEQLNNALTSSWCVLCGISVADRKSVGRLLTTILSNDPTCDLPFLRSINESILTDLLGTLVGPFVPPPGVVVPASRAAAPSSAKRKIASPKVHAHFKCLMWSPEVSVDPTDGSLQRVPQALRRGTKIRCAFCREMGATLGCAESTCRKSFHIPCALLCGSGVCTVDEATYTLRCAQHAHVALPSVGSSKCPATRKQLPPAVTQRK